jgi:serine/threonine protein kinase
MQPLFGTTTSPYPQPGDVLDGKYRIEHLLGEGGMGAVAKATHLLRRAPVALKFMSGAVLSLQGAVERFVNEGVAASQIDSDHVVKVFDVGRLPSGAPYLVMEYLEGCDLGQLLEREGPTLETARAVHFTVQALRALHTAHAAGIIHRDMKPSNCFIIAKEGEPDFVKLVDFGISKVRTGEDGQAAHLTRTNSALGTPLYMSPEQARSPRDVDHRTDLYSVGAILYEMLAGRTPYSSETGEYTEMLFKIFTTEPEPLSQSRPDLPAALVAIVTRALQRDPKARFASAAEMAEALSPFADERSSQVLSRLRGRRSGGPAHSITPIAPETRAEKSEATAQTFASAGVSGRPASTGMGVAREAGSPTGATRATRRQAGIAIAAVMLLAAGAGFFVLRAHPPATLHSDEPRAASASPGPSEGTIPLPGAGGAGEPSASSPTVTLTPENTAGPMASTTPSATGSARAAGGTQKPPPHPTATATAATTTPATTTTAALPTQLGDLKLH